MKPKEYTIPAKELTKLLVKIKKYQRYHKSVDEPPSKLAQLLVEDDFEKAVNNFFHFNCGVKLLDLTTENVLNDKFKI